MAADAPAPQRSLRSLDPQKLQLIIQALPIATELHAAENQCFAPLRQDLLALYGDEAAPNLLGPKLLLCAGRARDARLALAHRLDGYGQSCPTAATQRSCQG